MWKLTLCYSLLIRLMAVNNGYTEQKCKAGLWSQTFECVSIEHKWINLTFIEESWIPQL